MRDTVLNFFSPNPTITQLFPNRNDDAPITNPGMQEGLNQEQTSNLSKCQNVMNIAQVGYSFIFVCLFMSGIMSKECESLFPEIESQSNSTNAECTVPIF